MTDAETYVDPSLTDDAEDRLIRAGICPLCHGPMVTLTASMRPETPPTILAAGCEACSRHWFHTKLPNDAYRTVIAWWETTAGAWSMRRKAAQR